MTKPEDGRIDKPLEVMFKVTVELTVRSTISDNTLIKIVVNFGLAGGILMNMDDPDLQKDLKADVLSNFARCEHAYCPRFITCSSNPIELVDANDEFGIVSLKTKVDTFEREVFVTLPELDMINEGHGETPFILLDIELSDCQKHADAAVLRTRELVDEAIMPFEVLKICKKSWPLLTDSKVNDSKRTFESKNENKCSVLYFVASFAVKIRTEKGKAAHVLVNILESDRQTDPVV